MALPFTRNLTAVSTVYDCMDELSGFAGAPVELVELERELFSIADVVFTGGRTLFEAKRKLHPNVHAFPSSVDVKHFAKALDVQDDPHDQRAIPHPRVGYCGVIDERTDAVLLGEVARLRPEMHFVMIGPIVKVDPDSLPHLNNIHYLGQKSYQELPAYMSAWDVAILPFAHNDSTRFISPTKTPEYLAAGLPVVSTSIRDVVSPYGDLSLVRIADGPDAFSAALDLALERDSGDADRRKRVDELLGAQSWDLTKARMDECLRQVRRQDSSGYVPNSSHEAKEDACSTI
jgi:UDP-galactopyranose mutase